MVRIFSTTQKHSIVLMAVVNWTYQFTMIDIGDTGRQNDGGVFVASNIGQALDEELLNIPPQGAYTLILNYFHLFWPVTKPFQ